MIPNFPNVPDIPTPWKVSLRSIGKVEARDWVVDRKTCVIASLRLDLDATSYKCATVFSYLHLH